MFLFDIGCGLLITALISVAVQLPPSYGLLALGIIGSLLPDWDMVAYLAIKNGKLGPMAHKHRDISHYPLITVPLVAIFTGHYIGFWESVIISAAMTIHYFNDSLEIGWGICWLYPLSRQYFAYRSVGAFTKQFWSWSPTEQNMIANKFGNPNWTKEKRYWQSAIVMFLIGVAAVAIWFVI